MLGFGKGAGRILHMLLAHATWIPLSRFKEGAQDANKAYKASVEGNHRVSKGDIPQP
jgi:hypothetical protein